MAVIWYGSVRFLVESLKTNNWLFLGVPTAQIIAAITVGGCHPRHSPPSTTGSGPPDAIADAPVR